MGSLGDHFETSDATNGNAVNGVNGANGVNGIAHSNGGQPFNGRLWTATVRTNGHTNGHTNGYSNGRTNGYTNGHTNGTDGEEWFIGSIDQGTTSSRFLIFNREMDPVASHQIEFENYYPESGYVIDVPMWL